MPLRHFRSSAARDFNLLASGKVTLISGDLTTTSTTFVDVTGATLTRTTGARRVLISVVASGKHSGSDTISLDINIDGTRQGQTLGIMFEDSISGNNCNLSFTYITDVLTASSHTFKLQFKTGAAGTMTLYASSGTAPLVMSVVELPND